MTAQVEHMKGKTQDMNFSAGFNKARIFRALCSATQNKSPRGVVSKVI